jgi:hypothetical protein
MKSPLRLVKGSQQSEKKDTPREQRFRYGVQEVWEVSCGPARKDRPARKALKAS